MNPEGVKGLGWFVKDALVFISTIKRALHCSSLFVAELDINMDGGCGIIKYVIGLHHLADSYLSASCCSFRFSDQDLWKHFVLGKVCIYNFLYITTNT